MPDDILEALGRYRAPKKLPAIAMKGYEAYVASQNQITDATLDALRLDLRAEYDDLGRLTDLVLGLAVLGIYLKDTLKDPVAAEAIAKLLRETAPLYAPIGERIVAALQDAADKATRVLSRFSNGTAPARASAPKFGECAPKGSVPVKAMMPHAKRLT